MHVDSLVWDGAVISLLILVDSNNAHQFSQVAHGTSKCLEFLPSGSPVRGSCTIPKPSISHPADPPVPQALYLAASFDLYSSGNVVRSWKDPFPEPRDYPVHIHCRGLEGLSSLRVTVNAFRRVGDSSAQNGLRGSTGSSLDVVKHCSVDIVRKGIGRTYRVEITDSRRWPEVFKELLGIESNPSGNDEMYKKSKYI